MNRALIVCGIIAASFVLNPVAAEHGDHGDCTGEVIDLGVAYWVVTGDNAALDAWGYIESNGEPGLQRGGIALHGNPEVCQESENPDIAFY